MFENENFECEYHEMTDESDEESSQQQYNTHRDNHNQIIVENTSPPAIALYVISHINIANCQFIGVVDVTVYRFRAMWWDSTICDYAAYGHCCYVYCTDCTTACYSNCVDCVFYTLLDAQ